MRNRILSVIVACSLLLILLPVTSLALDQSQAADTLYSLGLFKGVGYREDGTPDYALTRTPTRSEAVTMLVRLLGREEEATSGNWTTPFTDVESWALPYVGYAYANGLTGGTGDTTFSGGAYISATQYLTLVLRALGYVDGTDFSWNAAWMLSDTLGLTSGEFTGAVSFSRGDIAAISCSALSQPKKNTQTTLLAALVQDGAVTPGQVTASGLTFALTAAVPTKHALTSEEVYAQCAPAVFSLVTYDADGEPYLFGSGFFIDSDGTAVTNYHVIDDAFSMAIATTEGSVYEDVSVLAFDIEQDVAVLKVNGDALFSYLTVNSSPVTGGQTVYAIGNPEGLTSTISSGLISNPSRQDFNGKIQISVPISSGSSGGALINQYGEVIGITTSGLTIGQNLNFAVPVGKALQLPRTVMTFAQVAEQSDIYDYENRPGPFEANYDEAEPNDCNAQAYFLDNGDSVWGSIDDGEYDTFLVRCSTSGVIRVHLFSFSPRYYADDLMLAVDTYDYEGYILGEHVEYTDGTKGIWAEYQVTEPGIYQIDVLSYYLYRYEELDTDYMFYYLFTPDGAEPDCPPSSAEAAQVFEQCQNIPDFGAWYGIMPTYTDSDSDVTTYDYYMFVVNTVTTLEGCTENYGWLLANWGFTYSGKFIDSAGYEICIYKNKEIGQAVYFGLHECDNLMCFRVMVTDL